MLIEKKTLKNEKLMQIGPATFLTINSHGFNLRNVFVSFEMIIVVKLNTNILLGPNNCC